MAAGPVVASGSEASSSGSSHSTTDPAASVDPFIGTGVGPGWTGAIGTFPGADLPSGMMQWSPDTPTTSPELGVSGGYYYPLHTIDGFSLDHLSGAGCSALEDFPVVPFAGAVGVSPSTDPTLYQSAFSHSDESASAGSYSVTLSNGVKVELTVTDRTGIGRFTFPHGVTPSILIDPEASEGGFSSGSVSVSGDDAFSGSDVSGDFCSVQGTIRRTSRQYSSPRSGPKGLGKERRSRLVTARPAGLHRAPTPRLRLHLTDRRRSR